MILTDVPFTELKIGDVVNDWVITPPPWLRVRYLRPNGPYRVARIADNCVWLQNVLGDERRLSSDHENLLFTLERESAELARVPCVRCGKLLHPALSAQSGVTHGC